MTKFSSKDDSGYKAVSGEIRRMVKKVELTHGIAPFQPSEFTASRTCHAHNWWVTSFGKNATLFSTLDARSLLKPACRFIKEDE